MVSPTPISPTCASTTRCTGRTSRGGPGFWAITRYDDCVTVNRDYERFSSAAKGTMPFEMEPDEIAQQGLMMLNMDPPLHTRYRRLVNKGFTPRMVRDLEASIHRSTDAIIDEVIETGRADFVTQISAELPLQVIAELLGVPQEDRHRMFEWSNRMVGNEDPEYQDQTELALTSAMELYAYASELFAKKRIDPHADLMSALTTVEIEGERLSDMELELFFLLLTVAGNETTRNLMSGAMHAFFQNPEQWQRLLEDRSLLPSAVDEMLRFVTPVMNFRRTAIVDTELSGTKIAAGDKVVFFHASANRDEDIFTDPDTFDIGRDPNPHIAFGGAVPTSVSGPTWPGWRSASCSNTCWTACPTFARTARCNASSLSSSTASSTSPWHSPRPPASAPEPTR